MRGQIKEFRELEAKNMLARYLDGESLETIASAHGINSPKNVYYYINKYQGVITDEQRITRYTATLKRKREVAQKEIND